MVRAKNKYDNLVVEDFIKAKSIETTTNVSTSGYTGNLLGNVTGDVLGDVVGNVTGNLSGDVIKQLTTYSADVDLDDGDFATTFIDLDGSTATANIIKFTPTAGKFYVFYCSDATNAVTITTSAGVTIDGTDDVATFATGDMLTVFAVTATTCLVVSNSGVTFS